MMPWAPTGGSFDPESMAWLLGSLLPRSSCHLGGLDLRMSRAAGRNELGGPRGRRHAAGTPGDGPGELNPSSAWPRTPNFVRPARLATGIQRRKHGKASDAPGSKLRAAACKPHASSAAVAPRRFSARGTDSGSSSLRTQHLVAAGKSNDHCLGRPSPLAFPFAPSVPRYVDCADSMPRIRSEGEPAASRRPSRRRAVTPSHARLARQALSGRGRCTGNRGQAITSTEAERVARKKPRAEQGMATSGTQSNAARQSTREKKEKPYGGGGKEAIFRATLRRRASIASRAPSGCNPTGRARDRGTFAPPSDPCEPLDAPTRATLGLLPESQVAPRRGMDSRAKSSQAAMDSPPRHPRTEAACTDRTGKRVP